MVVGDGEHSRWTVLMNRQGGVRGVHGADSSRILWKEANIPKQIPLLRPRSVNLKSSRREFTILHPWGFCKTSEAWRQVPARE